jgi:hypothetical protein
MLAQLVETQKSNGAVFKPNLEQIQQSMIRRTASAEQVKALAVLLCTNAMMRRNKS